MAPSELRTLFERLTPDLHLLAPRRVVPGEELFLLPAARMQRLHDALMDPPIRLEVVAARLGGQPLSLLDLPSDKEGVQITIGADPEEQRAALRGVRLDALGPAVVDVDVAVVILSPSGRRVVPLRTLPHRVEVVDAARRTPEALEEPALDDLVRNAIRVKRPVIAPDVDGRSHVVGVQLELTALEECALSFDLWAVPSGEGREIGPDRRGAVRMGSLTHPERAFAARAAARAGHPLIPMNFYSHAWASDELAAAARIDLYLEPRESRWISERNATRRWNRRIILSDLPVERPARSGGAS
jgi:hypothetical protein